MNIRQLFFALLLCLSIFGVATAQGTRLLRHPTVSRDSVAFEYAGDLWVVSRSGGPARRPTATPRVEIGPYFSPDRAPIAFTATVAGDTRAVVSPAAGGRPPQAIDLSSGRGPRPRVDSRWSPRGLRIGPRQRSPTIILPALDNRPGRRASGAAPDASRVQRRLFSRRSTIRV